jgi:lactate dehydrogenase-like 2-hydroxyacid dehydrogenase
LQLGQILGKWPFIAAYNTFGHLVWKSQKDVSKDIVLVTGGGGGIGQLVAKRFASAGSTIVLCDINEEAVKKGPRLVKSCSPELSSQAPFACLSSNLLPVISILFPVLSF